MNKNLAGERLAEREKLLHHAMARLDAQYDPAAGLIATGGGAHTVRSSAYYALGLLARDGAGDLARACRVIEAVTDMQIDAPEEVYHGTFRRSDRDPLPPRGNYPWRAFTPESRFMVDKWGEAVYHSLRRELQDARLGPEALELVEKSLRKAVVRHIPVVWETYDPNWRVFIATTFAAALSIAGGRLPAETLARLDSAMEKAVTGSIQRHEAGLAPMNTNVELMHLFTADYFGSRLSRPDFTAHALGAAERFLCDYQQFHAVAEFNSPTYCGVDLTALGMMRRFGSSARLREIASQLEDGLWRDIAAFYHPGLHNICGPYSRNYEMDMRLHTSMEALLYAGLGEERACFPVENEETAGDVLIAVGGIEIPLDIQDALVHFDGERCVERQFRELIERGEPGRNRPLCTATAWLGEGLMLGAMRGSQNTSNQLHPATAFWRTPDGDVASMRLQRRVPGESPQHLRTVFFNCTAQRRRLDIDVLIDVERDIEVYFEFTGPLQGAALTDTAWSLPGLRVHVEPSAPPVRVERTADGLCACYLSPLRGAGERRIHFVLLFEEP